MVAIQRILCPIDFSSGSDLAVARALLLAEALDARVHVLHVRHASTRVRADLALWMEGSTHLSVHDALDLSARQQMASWLAGLSPTARMRVVPHVVEGDPVDAIVEASARADLVVMATHGRSGVAHALLGSVAERVVRQARCPVMTLNTRTTVTNDPAAVPGWLGPVGSPGSP